MNETHRNFTEELNGIFHSSVAITFIREPEVIVREITQILTNVPTVGEEWSEFRFLLETWARSAENGNTTAFVTRFPDLLVALVRALVADRTGE